jgi:hypothetical protein
MALPMKLEARMRRICFVFRLSEMEDAWGCGGVMVLALIGQ